MWLVVAGEKKQMVHEGGAEGCLYTWAPLSELMLVKAFNTKYDQHNGSSSAQKVKEKTPTSYGRK